MKRQAARELAVQIICGADIAGESCCDFAEKFMDIEHYETLGEECEIFADYPDDNSVDYINELIDLMDEHRARIDEYICRYSRGWSLNRISSAARAVLRTAICEILYLDDVSVSTAINSAVEIDKGYDEPETVAFVNGVLGGFVRGENIDGNGEPADAE